MKKLLFVLSFVLVAWSCGDEKQAAREVVVYTALDRDFSEPIFREFTAKTGIRVRAKYDAESTKTVGLANAIRNEKNRPRCDVFWNNEILNTLLLKAEGLLQPCAPAEAENYAAKYRDPDGYWYGFAARARVIIVNTDLVEKEDYPESIHDLADERFRGKTGIAKPLFGTTASHVACLFVLLGEKRAEEYLRSLKRNDVQVHGGNKGCALAVSSGRNAFALTDTDDAIIERDAGKPVDIVYPDSHEGGMGTVFLPNTVAVVKGAPHPDEALALINYLLSPEVEKTLAEGPSAQIPLHRASPPNPRVKGPRDVVAADVDFDAAAAEFQKARRVVTELFLK